MSERADPLPDLVRRRLASQRLGAAAAESPGVVVRWMGAVQAQDFAGALWAVGMRCHHESAASAATAAGVEAAIAARVFVRSWPMRSTLHFVPGEDLRWMLRLLGPRQLAANRGRLRQLGLGESELAKTRRTLTRALAGGKSLSRPAVYAELERRGVSCVGQRGAHVLYYLCQTGFLCFGERDGKQPTFVLLEEWLPPGRDLRDDEALATLARTYFRGHGPAGLADFAWWSGLRLVEARRAIEAAGETLRCEVRGGATWYSAGSAEPASPKPRTTSRTRSAELLPPWDELLVGYRDRTASVGHIADHDERRLQLLGSSLLAVGGRVRGRWGRELVKDEVRVTIESWAPLTPAERRAVERTAERYAAFLGRTLELRFSS